VQFVANLLPLLALSTLLACSNVSRKPIDADTRRIIDSISIVEIQKVKIKTDSLYQAMRTTRLPAAVDSIKQRRLIEIAEQLRSVPR
jgi:hypothetical protein